MGGQREKKKKTATLVLRQLWRLPLGGRSRASSRSVTFWGGGRSASPEPLKAAAVTAARSPTPATPSHANALVSASASRPLCSLPRRVAGSPHSRKTSCASHSVPSWRVYCFAPPATGSDLFVGASVFLFLLLRLLHACVFVVVCAVFGWVSSLNSKTQPREGDHGVCFYPACMLVCLCVGACVA